VIVSIATRIFLLTSLSNLKVLVSIEMCVVLGVCVWLVNL